MHRQRAVALTAAAVAGAAPAVTAVLYVAAFSSLGTDGPNATGYGYLLVANHLVVVDAVVLSCLALVAIASGRARFIVGGLLAAAAVAFTAGAGSEAIGQALAAIDPTRQPIALNSALLALQGSGQDVLPASIVFAAAAMVGFARIRVRPIPVEGHELVRS